jgi:hypothetical protein
VKRVSAWRDGLAAAGHFPGQTDWSWPESLDGDYQTDKPDFDGYGAVQLWAAYAERPETIAPKEFPDRWDQDSVYLEACNHSRQFDHIIGPELWLPVAFDSIFKAVELNGSQPKIGSVFKFWEQLRWLNQVSWNAEEEDVRTWRKGGFDAQNFQSIARFGFSICFCLAEWAASRRLPMRLDY